ncbi:hypothetical protein H6758_00575 [Candidatus Nomurabacteria bacterium]|nr:hypothetical protein [Candidatus Nomurabacteria bacterium]
MTYIKKFLQLNKNDVSVGGGKGASLGEMIQSGIPVPDGFVVLTSAFEAFLVDGGLSDQIEKHLALGDNPDEKEVLQASQKIQQLILDHEMSSELQQAIMEAFRALDAQYVAVRSSATAEDSSAAAWAGQLESYLNTTEESVLENVKKCWASLFSPRAISYRFQHNLNGQSISVAVVIQKMVNSEKSGVAFSVHPVTQNENEIIIEAGFGLGEAIVSGQITPDGYVIQKNPLRILSIDVKSQSRGLYRKEGGDSEWLDISFGEKQVLSKEAILVLSEIVVRIEEHYGFPCDIEWAYENGSFFIVQSRPITTLRPVDEDSLGIPKNWCHAFMLGNQDVDCSFLTLEMTWCGMKDPMIEQQIGIPVPRMFEEMIQGSTLNTYVLAAPIEKFVKIAASALLERPELLNSLRQNTIESCSAMRQCAEEHRKQIDTYDQHQLADLLQHIRRLQADCVAYGTIVAWADITGLISQKLMDVINERKNLVHPTHWYSHVLGSPTEPSLTEKARMDIVKSGLSDEELCDQYFWLDQGYIGEGLTTLQLRETKKHALNQDDRDITASAAELMDELQLTDQERRYFEVSQDIVFIKSLRADSRQNLNVVVNLIAKRLAQLWGSQAYLIGVMSAHEILEIASDKKSLPEDLESRHKHCLLVPQSEDGHYKVIYGQQVAAFLGKTLQRVELEDQQTLRGQTAYQGLVRGKVRLVFGPQHNEKVKEGDILVSTATSPQLLPAMIRAIGFVTDVGGVTSHAAIVARELRKPCVVGTKHATQILRDGDEIEIDAENGVVRILKEG